MKVLHSGLGTSGLAIGKAVVLAKSVSNSASHSGVGSLSGEAAAEAFLKILSEETENTAAIAESNELMEPQVEMLEDSSLEDAVIADINEGQTLDIAVDNARKHFCGLFEGIDDEYLKARSADVEDLFNRLKSRMIGNILPSVLDSLEAGSVIVADSLATSDTVKMDVSKIAALVCEKGSRTSHVCIFAKNNGIPALVGVEGCDVDIRDGDILIVDADSGDVVINPDEATLKSAELRIFGLRPDPDHSGLTQDSVSEDTSPIIINGRPRQVMGNAGSLNEVKMAIAGGAAGIGLFRSEFSYMQGSDFPTEDSLIATYSEMARACNGNVLCIRTLDIGGDKALPFCTFKKEPNPFLGVRGIRFSLSRKDVFKTQLRAILRVSANYPLGIMFPMISDISELKEAKSVLNECKAELTADIFPFDASLPVGIMVETPAAVFCAEDLAHESDFFSIGTNDLTQYVMSADRGNPDVSSLCSPDRKAVLEAIRLTIEAGHKAGIKVSMCGEYASDPSATALLLSLGLDNFSVAPTSVRQLRHSLRKSQGRRLP